MVEQSDALPDGHPAIINCPDDAASLAADSSPMPSFEEAVGRCLSNLFNQVLSGPDGTLLACDIDGEDHKTIRDICFDSIITAVKPFTPSVANIAKSVHGALRGYCKFTGGHNEPSWVDSSAEYKEALIHGVVLIMNDPKVTVLELHEDWMAQKLAAGWKYDPVHNEEHKLHPCLTRFGKLNHTYQAKQHIFRGVVLEMLE